MSEREIIEKVVEILRKRAAGYEARATAIFNGRIMADELRGNAREIEALADKLPLTICQRDLGR